jgi:hypothetical protein
MLYVMSWTEVIVTLVVGFGSGLVGAFAGGWAQRWLYQARREDERLDDLWEHYRTLKVVSEQLMEERGGDVEVDLHDLERRLYRHFRYIPLDLTAALEVDEMAGARNRFEFGENLSIKAGALRRYLEQQRHPVRHRVLGIGRLFQKEPKS